MKPYINTDGKGIKSLLFKVGRLILACAPLSLVHVFGEIDEVKHICLFVLQLYDNLNTKF